MTMEHETGLQRVGSTGMAVFEPRSFGELERLAQMCASSKLFAITTPEAAMVVMLTGASLGLPPVAAMRGIHVVQGRAVLSSDLIVAVVMRSGQCDRWTVVENSPVRCIIETHRKGSAAPVRHQWAIEDAKRAGLVTKGIWQQFPAAMLRARCSAELGRIAYADVLFGVYVEGEIEGDAERVDVQRDDGPAESATVSGLDAFRAALAETADLAGFACVYRDHTDVLGGTKASAINALIVGRATACGYHLIADEAHALCAGNLDADLAAAYDALAAVTLSPDDEDGDGVIADVVRVMRRASGLRTDLKKRVSKVGVATAEALGVERAKARITAALNPPPPPTGTEGPARDSSDPAAPIAATVAANAQHVAAQASAEPRVVLDRWTKAEARLLRADAVGDAAWCQRLVDYAAVFAMAGAFHKRREAFAVAGVLATRRAQTLDAIEAREQRGPEAARQALDGYATRRVMPRGYGEVIRMPQRPTATRTGTDG